MRKSYLLACMTAGFVVGCGSNPESTDSVSAEQAQTRIPSSVTDTASLGQAYLTGEQRVLAVECIQGTEVPTGNVSGSTVFTHDATFEDVIETLTGNVHVAGTISTVRLEGQADIALKHAKTDHSETIQISRTYLGGGTRLAPNSYSVTAAGNAFAQNPYEVEQHCGQEFINEIRRGASLIATLKVEFFNDDDSLDVGGKLNVDTASGIISADGSVQYVDQAIKRRTKISLVAHQSGGDPVELLGVIPSTIVNCTMDAPTPCLEAFKNVFDYANTQFVDQVRAGKLNVLSYVSEAYRDVAGAAKLVPPGQPTMVDPLTIAYMQTIEARLHTAMTDAERASGLLSLGEGRLTLEQRTAIEDVRSSATHNTMVYSNVLKTCLNDLPQCQSWGQQIEAGVWDYDSNVLNPQTCSAKTTYYADLDRDGYGDPATARETCNVVAGAVTRGGDCCDRDARANPGATSMLGPSQCGIEAGDAYNDIYRDANCDGVTEWLGWGYTR